jgi:hypothetical protein
MDPLFDLIRGYQVVPPRILSEKPNSINYI